MNSNDMRYYITMDKDGYYMTEVAAGAWKDFEKEHTNRIMGWAISQKLALAMMVFLDV